jgi:hypothetical protein
MSLRKSLSGKVILLANASSGKFHEFHIIRPYKDAVCFHTKSVFTPQYICVTGDSLSTVEVYDPFIGRWQLAEAMSMLRSRVGVAVMRNRLYAFGGYNGCERLSTVEVFDPQKRAWSRVSPMHCKRRLVLCVDVINLAHHLSCTQFVCVALKTGMQRDS